MEVEEQRNPEEEQFRRLAEELGEPLAAVWSMGEQERRQLIQLLLEGGGDEAAARAGGRAEKHTAAASPPTAAASPPMAAASPPTAAGVTPEANYAGARSRGANSSHKPDAPPRQSWAVTLLHNDATKVMRMLQGTRNEAMEKEQVVAYLEAHMLDPRRVQVVVDELSGVAEEQEQEEEKVTLAELAEVFADKGKGRGKTSIGVKRRLEERAEHGGKVARTDEQEGRVARTGEQEGRGTADLVIEITDSPVKVSPAYLSRVGHLT